MLVSSLSTHRYWTISELFHPAFLFYSMFFHILCLHGLLGRYSFTIAHPAMRDARRNYIPFSSTFYKRGGIFRDFSALYDSIWLVKIRSAVNDLWHLRSSDLVWSMEEVAAALYHSFFFYIFGLYNDFLLILSLFFPLLSILFISWMIIQTSISRNISHSLIVMKNVWNPLLYIIELGTR